jgi:hypothetical protein
MGKEKYILGLDISTKCIGCALFEDLGQTRKLLLLSAIKPSVKPVPTNKLEELFRKVQIFEDEFISKYNDLNITKVIIEEPLLSSNNVYTVGTLLRFNGMISKSIYDKLNIVPEFISSYDSRLFAFPELLSIRKQNKKGELYSENELKRKIPVLFGGYPYEVDKKEIIWKLVSNLEPKVSWLYDKRGILKTENYDQADAYCCVLGKMKKDLRWK